VGTIDQVGEVVPPGPVRRVVPLAPDVTELAFAVGAGSLVVAVPPAADFPPGVAALARVAPGDAEAVIAQRPDLVLATTAGNDPRTVQRLRQLGTRVCTMDVTSFARLGEACRLVGYVLGFSAQGERLARDVDERVAKATARAGALPVRKALYVVWWEPLIVAAPGTFHDDMLRRAGLANLAPGSAGRYPRVDPEILLDPRLEVVVAPDERDLREGFARTFGSPAGDRLASGAIPVVWLPADLANRPGPRLPAALEALVAAREAEERQGSGARGQGFETQPPVHRQAPTSQGRST
jgi:ABC-type Fe3+-hydroxamate transport system substrate-binding protein